jgi:basic membrane lipoprotein Med (substrate-binding protein (PBP1-ABC) superfamily)
MLGSAVSRGIGVGLTVALTVACARQTPVVPSRFSVRLVTSATLSGHWERAAERGLGRIGAELDADVERLRVGGTDGGRPRLAELGRAGVDLVFCVGGGLERAVFIEAAAHPGTVFMLLPGRAREPNVGGIEFMSEGAGYLAGIVAAEIAPGPRAGVIRGRGGPWLEAVEAGFAAGYRVGSRRAVVDPVIGVDGIEALGSGGVEIALYATDVPRSDELEAAAAAGLKLVAADSELMERAPQLVVAAVEVDVPVAMLRVAREVRDGTFRGQVYAFDVGSGVLDVRLNETLAVEVAEPAREAMEAARTEVTAGVVEIEGMGL